MAAESNIENEITVFLILLLSSFSIINSLLFLWQKYTFSKLENNFSPILQVTSKELTSDFFIISFLIYFVNISVKVQGDLDKMQYKKMEHRVLRGLSMASW